MSAIDRRRESLDKLYDSGTADNMFVRLAIVERMNKSEITLEQAQAEIRKIKREARKAGRHTWGGRA